MQIKFGNRKHGLKVIFNTYIKAILASIAVLVIRTFVRPKKEKSIVVLSHTLGGNALAFSLWLIENHPEIKLYFATDLPAEFRRLKNSDKTEASFIKILSTQSFRDVFKISKASVVLSTHGPASLYYWKYLKNTRRPVFFDCWHGVGFKGGLAKGVDTSLYKGVFVSSPHFAELHKIWGLPDEKIFITGYARTDRILDFRNSRDKTLNDFDLDSSINNLGLFAPTWSPSPDENEFLFGLSMGQLVDELNQFAIENSCYFIFRMHINNSQLSSSDTSRVFIRPSSKYPDTEKLLQITDFLITDWSSMFTDYLALKRPTVFIDTEMNFANKGLKPDTRSGKIVHSTQGLVEAMETITRDKPAYVEHYRHSMEQTIELAWGDSLDKKSSERYFNAISGYINEQNT